MDTKLDAHVARATVPERAEGLDRITSQTPERATSTDAPDSAVQNSSQQTGDDKLFATLAARAALQRCVLRRMDGGFLITRTAWGLSRSLASLPDVAALLNLMEGTR